MQAAKSVMLANIWDPSEVDPAGYWISEKLDGVRAYWTGSTFYSRQGNKFEAIPEWFLKQLPDVPLDGEMWGGRDTFAKTAGLLKRKQIKDDTDEEWKKITYIVFDAPSKKGKYEERVEHLKTVLKGCKVASAIGIEKCRDFNHIDKCMQEVISKGGEGLMLRKPGSEYQKGRSNNLLKVKQFHDDEAIVVDYVYKEGSTTVIRHLECRLGNGQRFSVGGGFSDEQRKNPPKKGAIITIKFQELQASGKPRFPVFLRERKDLSWDEVVDNHKSKSHFKAKIAVTSSTKGSVLFMGNVSSSVSVEEKTTKVLEEASDEEPPKKKTKTSDKPTCKFGKGCYRNNADHLQEFAHPWKDEAPTSPVQTPKTPKSDTPKTPKNSDGLKECKYGEKCYNKSEDHLQKFSHGAKPEKKTDKEEVKKSGSDTDEMDESTFADLVSSSKKNEGGSDTDQMSDREVQISSILDKYNAGEGSNSESEKKPEIPVNRDSDNEAEMNSASSKKAEKPKKKKAKKVDPYAEFDDDEDDELPLCIYDENCTRKNPQHFKEFSHPLRNIQLGAKKKAKEQDKTPDSPQSSHSKPKPKPKAQSSIPQNDEKDSQKKLSQKEKADLKKQQANDAAFEKILAATQKKT